MPSPLLSSSHNQQFHISGDVTVHPSAAIAPGVLLQADPGSRIVVAEGVCIGMGTVLHASGGDITIAPGSTLGVSVLLAGQVAIGSHACVGANVTIWNDSVDEGAVIPPGCLIGDASAELDRSSEDRSVEPDSIPPSSPEAIAQDANQDAPDVHNANVNAVDPDPTVSTFKYPEPEPLYPPLSQPNPPLSQPNLTESQAEPQAEPQADPSKVPTASFDVSASDFYTARFFSPKRNSSPAIADPWDEASQAAEPPKSPPGQPASFGEPVTPDPPEPFSSQPSSSVSSGESSSTLVPDSKLGSAMHRPMSPIYGKESLNRLMTMMFPHRRSLDSPSQLSDGSESSDSPTSQN